MPNQFADITVMDKIAQQDARTRAFVGDGSVYLRVPGLKSVEAINVGGADVPPKHTQKLVQNLSMETYPETIDLFRLGRAMDGTPVLVRNKQSNFGIWQKGAMIYVRGEWEEDAPQEVTTEPTNDAPKRGKK